MSDYEDRLDALRKQAERAAEVASDLDQGAWSSPDWHKQAEGILAYARLVLQATDAELVSPAIYDSLSARLQEWIDSPGQFAADRDAWCNQILEGLAQLPVGRGRDVEQQVKAAAATFQRSAQQRFTGIHRQTETVGAEVQALEAHLVERRAEIEGLIEQARVQQDQAGVERLSQLDARSQEIKATVELHAQSIDSLLTEQTEAFRKVQDERAVEYRDQQQAYKEQIGEIETDSRRRVDELVAEIETMKKKSAELVGAIGITGTAERYGKEFEEQRKTADIWRWITLVIGALAVVAAVVAAFDHKATTAGTKLAIAILLGGVAAYTARQSSRHRRREEHARQLQLDLTAFPVFIEALSEEDREAATVWMAERSFLGARTSSEDDDDAGPSLLGQFITRRKATKD
jgi:hypothetical protein